MFLPQHERVRMEKRNIERELSKQKQINRDLQDIQRMEDELEELRYNFYEL